MKSDEIQQRVEAYAKKQDEERREAAEASAREREQREADELAQQIQDYRERYRCPNCGALGPEPTWHPEEPEYQVSAHYEFDDPPSWIKCDKCSVVGCDECMYVSFAGGVKLCPEHAAQV